MNKEQFSKYINNFDFTNLFREQGWDNFAFENNIEVQNSIYSLKGLVQKRNFPILQCISTQNKIPDHSVRKQISNIISKSYFFDHLLIITNKDKSWQYWQLPMREDGKLKQLVLSTWHKGQDTEGLFQKFRNIVFTLDEEENITLADVMEKVNTLSANSEKVTKKFYTEFIKQHDAFLEFIKGIDDVIPNKDNAKKQWYASLMLNRLMFCYFIQKKGFLDWNINYLREKLEECKKLKGKNNFFGFYRSFLLELFHNELGKPKDKRSKTMSPVPFGNIPYLNGGIFDVHELESTYKDISIDDKAFEKVFAFFDEWEWHLDTRQTSSGRDINPDVIGYIFEKYINQKEMGAYYTKEDITDYIGKNTIIPFLLDKVKEYYPEPFMPGGGFWQYLQDSGDEYIYDSVKKGAEGAATIDDIDIPSNIKIGIDTTKPDLLERRKDWNTVTPSNIGLPTEIWRETIARLQRYFELKTMIKKGKIHEINDLITYNMNIRKLIQDYLEQTQDAKFIRNFYKALCEITILDPTCGSGAFLFAALNILQQLYEICLQRMQEFYEEDPKRNTDFEQRLEPILSGKHPSITYYIFKTIILHNLFGIDIMKEAVEIAKLRLFLKLVAEVDPSRRKPNYGLEPLPDIDFNIRAGNTLVGFATENQLEEIVRNTEGDLIYKEKLEELKSACDFVSAEYKFFQKLQTETSINNEKYKEHKKSLITKLKELDEKLNRYLADTYGLGTQTQWKSVKEKEKAYQDWKASHQPFHWLAEFYEIMSKGGFDVVIGNPPYVEYRGSGIGDRGSGAKDQGTGVRDRGSGAKDQGTGVRDRGSGGRYQVKNYETIECGNLHSFIAEQCIKHLSHKKGIIGIIVPLPSINTSRMISLQKLIKPVNDNNSVWISSFDERPSSLFNGVDQRLIIEIIRKNMPPFLFTTGINRWNAETREGLFSSIIYVKQSKKDIVYTTSILKIKNLLETNILTKFYKNNTLSCFRSEQITDNLFFYRTAGGRYWKIIQTNPTGTETLSEKKAYLNNLTGYQAVSIISSSLFWWYYSCHFDMFNLKDYMIFGFRISNIKDSVVAELDRLGKKYEKSLEKYSVLKTVNSKTRGCVEQKQYNIRKSKPIIDEIDKVLAKHYGFTEEELDFIINYDIKYRMGTELEGDNE